MAKVSKRNRAERIVGALDVTFDAVAAARRELTEARKVIGDTKVKADNVLSSLNEWLDEQERIVKMVEQAHEEYMAKAKEIDERVEKLDDELAERQAEAEKTAEAIIEDARQSSATMIEKATEEAEDKIMSLDKRDNEITHREAEVTLRENKLAETKKKLDAKALEFAGK